MQETCHSITLSLRKSERYHLLAQSNYTSCKMEAHLGAKHFDKVAATYEPRGASSKISKTAGELIAFAPPISQSSIVLDNASGPGIITGEILRQSESAGAAPQIYAADISPAMIETLRQKNWTGVKSDVMDAQELSYADDFFTHSFMNMGIFLIPDPEKGAAEIYRTLKFGGVAVITSIKQVGWVRTFQAAQREVRPEAPLWKGLLKEEWSTEEKLKSVLQAGGFSPESIDIKTTESSQPSHMIGSFLASIKDNVALMITKDWSEAEKQQFAVVLEEQFENRISKPQEYEIILWVALARK
jgi:ubiquinone/menaquinone biosynthesis C-methylase UbiE